jgi:hypothetical protein
LVPHRSTGRQLVTLSWRPRSPATGSPRRGRPSRATGSEAPGTTGPNGAANGLPRATQPRRAAPGPETAALQPSRPERARGRAVGCAANQDQRQPGQSVGVGLSRPKSYNEPPRPAAVSPQPGPGPARLPAGLRDQADSERLVTVHSETVWVSRRASSIPSYIGALRARPTRRGHETALHTSRAIRGVMSGQV